MPENNRTWVSEEQKTKDKKRIHWLIGNTEFCSESVDERLSHDLQVILKAAVSKAIDQRRSAAIDYDNYTKFIGVLEALFNADWIEAEVYLQNNALSSASLNTKGSITRVRTVLKRQIEAYITRTEYSRSTKPYLKDSIQEALLKYIEWWVYNWYTGEFE